MSCQILLANSKYGSDTFGRNQGMDSQRQSNPPRQFATTLRRIAVVAGALAALLVPYAALTGFAKLEEVEKRDTTTLQQADKACELRHDSVLVEIKHLAVAQEQLHDDIRQLRDFLMPMPTRQHGEGN